MAAKIESPKLPAPLSSTALAPPTPLSLNTVISPAQLPLNTKPTNHQYQNIINSGVALVDSINDNDNIDKSDDIK